MIYTQLVVNMTAMTLMSTCPQITDFIVRIILVAMHFIWTTYVNKWLM